MLFRTGNREMGTALIEFAIILPLLVALLIGIAEFGLFIYDKQVITNASREGARFGVNYSVPRKTLSQIRTKVTTYTSNYLVTFGAANTPQVTAPAVCANTGDNLAVTVTYNYSPLVVPNALMAWVMPATVTASTVMLCE